MMLGAMRMGVPRANYPIVDVRDVARAHVLAGEQSCEGRFIVVNDVLPTFREMLETMHRIDPRIALPIATLPDFVIPMMPLFDRLNEITLGAPRIVVPELLASIKGKVWGPSNRRIKEVLGWEQKVSLEETLRDTIATLRARKQQAQHRAA
jgi:nucleoside-diphosphate-sugar epimerase